MNRPHRPFARLCASLSLLVACSSPGGGGAKASVADGDRATKLQTVRAKLAGQDYDAALLITDELIKRDKTDKEAILLAAQGNLEMARVATKGTDALIEDAISCYQRAAELDAMDANARLGLSRAFLMRSRFEEGRRAAMDAAELLRTQKAPQAKVAEAILAAADCEMQIFVDARTKETSANEKPAPGTIQKAEMVLQHANFAKAAAPGAAYLRSAQVYTWLGQQTEALMELERGISLVPDDAALHAMYMETYFGMDRRSECVASYKRLLKEHNHSHILLWNLGRAQQALGDDYRSKGRFDDASTAYRESEQSLRQYQAIQPQHAEATRDYLAILALSLARTALESGDLEGSKQGFARAYELSPKVADNDVNGAPLLYDSLGGTYAGGLARIGQTIVVPSTREALEQGLGFYRTVLARHPDRFGFMFNNAALTARDLGNAYEKESPEDPDAKAKALATARPLYEQSYQWYEKAVALEPNDARITNDCGLMLVYHLKRDYPRARVLFEKAIELGEAQLKDLPAETEAATRNSLEEAVGDAWQNIAVLLLQTGEAWEKAKPFCEKAVIYYPYQNRAAAALLRNDGRAATGNRRDAGTPQKIGSAAPPAPGAESQAQSGLDLDPQDKAKAQAWAKVKADADAKVKENDLDAALLILDGAEKELRGYAPYHLQRGLYNWQYAVKTRDAGGRANLVESLYSDAINQLKKAVELDGEPVEPRLQLVRLYVEHGDYEPAADAATSLLSHMRSLGGASKDQAKEAHIARAKASSRVYIDAKTQGKDKKPALESARESLKELDKQKAIDDELVTLWITLERWAGANDLAMSVAGKYAAEHPDADAPLAQIIDLAQTSSPVKAVEMLGTRTDPRGLWYLGRARFLLGMEQWSTNPKEPKDALVTMAKARDAFGQAKAGNPVFGDSCDQWNALTLGAEGYMRISADDHEGAQKALLASAQLRPDKIVAEFNPGSSTKNGILILGGKYAAGDLEKMTTLFRAAHAAAKAEVDFANNLGLAARDYGTQVERSGKAEEAMKLYEESYAAYTAACDLEPNNVRLQNDRALILLYNLRRDTEKAKEWLVEATARGDKQLKENPPATKDDRNNLEEAVGDAYQNLGYYEMTYAKNLAEAKKWYTKSLDYYSPSKRAESRGALGRMQRLEKAEKGEGKDTEKKDTEKKDAEKKDAEKKEPEKKEPAKQDGGK